MTPIEVLTQATFAPLSLSAIVLTTAAYLFGVRRIAANGQKWPVWRTRWLLLGELALTAGLVSGIDANDHVFSVHAIQHVLIGIVGPLFLALSAPVTLVVRVSRGRTHDAVLRLLGGRSARAVLSPYFTWALYAATAMILYITGLYALSVRNNAVGNLVHLGLILVGYLYWMPLVAVDPIPKRMGYWGRILYVMLSMPLYTILGMSLESQSTRIAPGVSLTELHTGGGILWFAGEAVGLVGAITLFVLWLRSDEKSADTSDHYNEESAARQLAHWRATRDAAARAASH
jgi:putative membrane protein